MKVLVTGGTGFIGSALVRHLIAANYEVRVLARHKNNRFLLDRLDVEIVDGDVVRPKTVDRAVKGCSVVFDLASLYAFYPFWKSNPRAIYRINVEGTVNLLEASLRHGVKKYIHTSTIASIGKMPGGKHSDETSAFQPKGASHYARSKYLAEQEVLKYCLKGLPAVILNPAIVIGERDYKPTPSGDVIVKFLNRTLPGYFETLWAVADADDVARAHIAAIDRGRVGERYILCNKKHHTLKEIFQILSRVSGVKAPRFKIPYPLLFAFLYADELISHFILRKKPLLPSEGVKFCKMSIRFDNSKAVRELQYSQTPIEDTLRKAVVWYRKNGYVESQGILRLKAGAPRIVKWVMEKIGMDRYTDKLNPATLVFHLVVQSLHFLRKLGVRPKKDGWRTVTQSYVRTEQSKFALAAFGLNLWSGQEQSEISWEAAKDRVIVRLQSFLKRHRLMQHKLKWHSLFAESEPSTTVDMIYAEFEKDGSLKDLELFLDADEEAQLMELQLSRDERRLLIKAVIRVYNETRSLEDKCRCLVLKRQLEVWCGQQKKAFRDSKLVRRLADRVLCGVYISFEKSAVEQKRFEVPCFIKFKHPGYGLLNIRCRLTHDFKEADLWMQFSHIPVDGVPSQEVLNDLKRSWGRSPVQFPSVDYRDGMTGELVSARDGKAGTYHVYKFVDFQPFLKLRRELNKRFSREGKETITSAALFIWKLVGYDEFKEIKFAIPVDLAATPSRERTLGFVFIRPGIYFDKNQPDRGFFKFQEDFNRQLRAARKRASEAYELMESYALLPPVLFSVGLKLFRYPLHEFVGSIGLTIIKKADFFISPSSDVHTEGFIALSNFSLASSEGGKVSAVSIKGPKEKIEKYIGIIDEIMNKAIQHDELYF